MGNPNQLIISERTRRLPQITFVPSSTLTLTGGLPLDTVLKGLNIRLSGSIITTYASGTPVADSLSTMDNLVSAINIRVNGGRLIKNVRPHFLHMQQLFGKSINGERKCETATGSVPTTNPTADGGFSYGSTADTSSVAETVYLAFENIMADNNKEMTWLNLKGRASAEMQLQTGAYSALLGFGNTAPVVYTAGTFVIDISTVEAQHVDAQTPFWDWRQTMQQSTQTGQVTDFNLPVNRGNFLQGLMFLVNDGAAGTTTTATGKPPSNLALTDIKLVLNGQTEIKATNFLELQALNKAQFGISAAYASNVSRIDGVCYLDLLTARDLKTALDVRAPGVDQVFLKYSTRASGAYGATSVYRAVSYTNPVSIQILTNEIIPPM